MEVVSYVILVIAGITLIEGIVKSIKLRLKEIEKKIVTFIILLIF